MATLGKSPLLLSGSADAVGNDGKHWAVTSIRYVTKGTDGAGQLLDKAGGREIAFFGMMAANPMGCYPSIRAQRLRDCFVPAQHQRHRRLY